MNIIILDGYTVVSDDLSWDFLKKYGDLNYYERTEADQIIQRIGNAEIVITSKCVIDRNVINNCPNMKYIGVIATGYNNIDIEYAREKNITVTNIPAYSTDSVAQFTFALMLEAANHVGVHNDSVQDGGWSRSKDFSYALTPQIGLSGKIIGIVGYGSIGKKVAAIANSLGMKTLVHSSHMNSNDSTAEVEYVSLETLLNTSDIISLHCALTDKNKEMINSRSIAMMKDGVILINTSRGALINEHDLAQALKTRKVETACLDVLAKEPPDKDNPLIPLNNCIMTPHIAWFTMEARQRILDVTEKNILSFIRGGNQNKIV